MLLQQTGDMGQILISKSKIINVGETAGNERPALAVVDSTGVRYRHVEEDEVGGWVSQKSITSGE
jgi:hypothetical protein